MNKLFLNKIPFYVHVLILQQKGNAMVYVCYNVNSMAQRFRNC